MPAKPNSQVNLPNTLNLIENHYKNETHRLTDFRRHILFAGEDS